MIRAVKAVSTYRGRDPRDFALFAFGGNGPVVGAQLAGMMEMRHVIIPPGAGVFSAFGLLLSDLEHEMAQGYLRPLAEMTVADLASRFAKLERAVALLLGQEALGAAQFTRLADLRYTGQAHELTITVPDEPLDMARLATAFGDEHERNYGHRADADAVECVTLRVVGRLPVSRASQIASRMPGTAASRRRYKRASRLFRPRSRRGRYARPRSRGSFLQGAARTADHRGIRHDRRGAAGLVRKPRRQRQHPSVRGGRR